MPTVSLTVTAPQAVRVQAALGSTDPITGIRTPATLSDIQTFLKNYVKGVVQQYEATLATQATTASVSSEAW